MSTRARSYPTRRARSAVPLMVLAAAVVVGLGILALVMTGGGDDPSGEPSAFGSVTISGEALVSHEGDPSADPALGLAAPTLEGHDFDAMPSGVDWDDGRPKVLMFLAHWCPACQAEVPIVVEVADEGAIPEGVDVIGVTTGTDERAPNFPPSAWLEDEGWTLPTIVDDADNSAADAFGLTGYPFFVLIDGEGNIAGRFAGQIGRGDLERLLSDLAGSPDDA